MRFRCLLFLSIFLFLRHPAPAQQLLTHYERSGYLETPRYEPTLEYSRRLADLSPWISLQSIGKSPQGRDIPFMIVDRDGLTDPDAIRKRGRIILLVQAGIHPGEPEGKDAMLVLLRDIAIHGKGRELLENVSIAFIPIFNVDGHERFGPYNRINQNGPKEMGWRTTAQNLNLNRDFIKAEAPEMKHWLAMYNRWLPEFFIDIHTTDGADYQYPLTYDLNSHGNVDAALKNWLLSVYEKRVVSGMDKAGKPIFPYVEFREWHDIRSGIVKWDASPILSHGYTSVQNRAALLIETHMLKNYKTRVEATIEMVKQTLRVLNEQASTLRQIVLAADRSAADGALSGKRFPLSTETSFADSTMTTFKGYAYRVEKSDITGGERFIYDTRRPMDLLLPVFDQSLPRDFTTIPQAYIIPVEWQGVIGTLKLHGIEMAYLTQPVELPVHTYKFSKVQFRRNSSEGRQIVSAQADSMAVTKRFEAGSAVVFTNQRAVRAAISALEPKAPGSLFEWGYFNVILEQKEYAESFIMEEKAREMLKQDPALKAAFDKKVAEDPDFRKNPYTVINWFYERSPYWDSQYNIYPIGRVFDAESIRKLQSVCNM